MRLPFPVPHFRQVLAVFVNVLLVLNQLVLHHLFEIGPFRAQIWQAIDYVLNQMKAIQIILYSHVESGRNGALFVIASNMDVAVGATIGQPMH